MSVFVPPSPVQEKWWLPILPPALIAVTVSMTIFPLSAGLYVILDPFCPLEDIDIQFMKYQPNFWALIPMFCEILMKSTWILCGKPDGAYTVYDADGEQEGYYVPYLFVILEKGRQIEDVREGILNTLQPYEYPVEIRELQERPYFHCKTNRKELTAAIVAETA